jgi:hypothetical protein
MKTLKYWLGGLVFVIALGWLLHANQLAHDAVFGPTQAAVDRNIFEQSKSYRQGAIQELQNMQFEYVKANPDQQRALRSTILHRAADLPADAPIPYDLLQFIQELKK